MVNGYEDCNTFEQLTQHFNFWLELSGNMALGPVIKKTGCLKPCQHLQYLKSMVTIKSNWIYQLISNNAQDMISLNNSFAHGFTFGFSTTTEVLKEEIWSYPFVQYLAEVGGSLGLFLGFSFLGILDPLLNVLQSIKRKWLFGQSTFW